MVNVLKHLMNQITPAGAVMQLGAKNTGLGNRVFDFPELMDSPSAGIRKFISQFRETEIAAWRALRDFARSMRYTPLPSLGMSIK